MKSLPTPTAEQLEKLAAMALKPESRAYFFDRLDNPTWVGPLSERGFFANPPAPEPAGEPGYVRFPPWPEARYLQRVASLAPADVVAVLRNIEQSENPSVTRQVLAVANALPDGAFLALVDRVVDWLGGPQVEFFADDACAAIVRMFELGEIEFGIAASSILLAIMPDPRLAEMAAKVDSPFRPHPEAKARMSDWNYERALDEITGPMIEHAGIKGFALLSALVDETLSLSRWEDEGAEDYSVVWRPAIEDHDQNSDRGIRNALVSATRDAAVRLATLGPDQTADVLGELRNRSIVNQRVGLHVVAALGGQSLVDQFVGNRELFDDRRFKHEYSRLLELRFDEVSADTQAQVLGWIDEGPDVDRYRQRRHEIDGKAPAEEDVARYVRIWKRDWQSFLEGYLAGEDAENYRELVDELGPPEHAGFVSWSSSWTGPESPFSSGDLHERDPEEVIELLRDWKPTGPSPVFGPSIEGLGRVLSEVVKTRAEDYALVGQQLVGLDPTYVRSYLSGLGGALRDGGSIEWGPPLALAEFVARKEFEADVEVPDRDRDPGWRWCRREISSFLQIGFAKSDPRMPFEHRARAWAIIRRLVEDPNPSPAHEDRYGGDNMDPLTLSMNTNRGEALHAVVEYALWVRRALEAQGEDVSAGFELMPEVAEVLDLHLDTEADPSLAVRAVYGRWLPWLHLLDEQWVIAQIGLLFPPEPHLAEFRDATWSTYLMWCPPFDSVFRALRGEYDLAVRRVPSDGTVATTRRESAESKLGEHLVTLHWRGVVDDALLDDYLARAGDHLAAEVLEFVGRALRNTAGELDDGVRERIERLWARRLDLAEGAPDEHRIEARSFGVSFSAGKLDAEWALASLERSVTVGGSPLLSSLVIERLVGVARTQPAIAARIVASMLAQSKDEWEYIGWKEEAREIVSLAVATEDADVVEDCQRIIDFFVKRGELDFRAFLR